MSAAEPIGASEAGRLFAGLEHHSLIALAVSGGRDSMALLRLVARWAGEEGPRPRIAVLTVNHGLRVEAGAEVAAVARWCAALGVDHHRLDWVGPKPATRIQEWAREARYRLMADWARDNGAGALVAAHHLEDQAETVLMRLARASGVDGLSGMAPETRRDGVAIVRPLLGVARARLEATLADFGQDWIDDPSNDDRTYERVRLRRVMPHFADVGLTSDMIASGAAKLARAATALDDLAARTFAATVTFDPAGYARIDRERLASEPLEIVMRVMARTLGAVGGGSAPADRSLERGCESVLAGDRIRFTLGRCAISADGPQVLVVREMRHLPRCDLAPGERRIWDDRFAVSLGAGATRTEVRALGRDGLALARRVEPSLGALPPGAGAALPGGFRGDELVLAPILRQDPCDGALTASFLHVDADFYAT